MRWRRFWRAPGQTRLMAISLPGGAAVLHRYLAAQEQRLGAGGRRNQRCLPQWRQARLRLSSWSDSPLFDGIDRQIQLQRNWHGSPGILSGISILDSRIPWILSQAANFRSPNCSFWELLLWEPSFANTKRQFRLGKGDARRENRRGWRCVTPEPPLMRARLNPWSRLEERRTAVAGLGGRPLESAAPMPTWWLRTRTFRPQASMVGSFMHGERLFRRNEVWEDHRLSEVEQERRGAMRKATRRELLQGAGMALATFPARLKGKAPARPRKPAR